MLGCCCLLLCLWSVSAFDTEWGYASYWIYRKCKSRTLRLHFCMFSCFTVYWVGSTVYRNKYSECCVWRPSGRSELVYSHRFITITTITIHSYLIKNLEIVLQFFCVENYNFLLVLCDLVSDPKTTWCMCMVWISFSIPSILQKVLPLIWLIVWWNLQTLVLWWGLRLVEWYIHHSVVMLLNRRIRWRK